MSTVVPLFSTGSRYWPAPAWPSGTCSSGGGSGASGARGRVGLQATKRSPISDCGRRMQLASARKSWKAGSVMSSTTIALPSCASSPDSRLTTSPGSETSTDWTVPAFAPAIRTSSPGTMNEPLSNTARTR